MAARVARNTAECIPFESIYRMIVEFIHLVNINHRVGHKRHIDEAVIRVGV